MDFQKVLHLENGEWGAHKRSKSDLVGRESRDAAKNPPHSKFFCAHTQLATQPTQRRHQHAVKMP